jgi:hypothetical protein
MKLDQKSDRNQAFISHFGEYWPRKFQVVYNGKFVTSDDWPRIVTIAKKTNIRLHLDFRWQIPCSSLRKLSLTRLDLVLKSQQEGLYLDMRIPLCSQMMRNGGLRWKKSLKRQKKYEDRADLVNAAEIMFQFFLHSRFDGPTVGKYWGALFRLIAVSFNSAARFSFNF